MATMRKVPVPVILLLLTVLSFLFLAHGLYGFIDLFGSPDLSPEATLLTFALCFLLAAVATGSRRALLLPRGSAADGDGFHVSGVEVAVGGEPQLADNEAAPARRVDLQTQDYPGSGANGRHDPRNPH